MVERTPHLRSTRLATRYEIPLEWNQKLRQAESVDPFRAYLLSAANTMCTIVGSPIDGFAERKGESTLGAAKG
jgi:hypothetical protein